MSEWQPIESAPRDREILVLFELSGPMSARFVAKPCRFEPKTGFFAPCDHSPPERRARAWTQMPPIPDYARVKAAIAERQARLAREMGPMMSERLATVENRA